MMNRSVRVAIAFTLLAVLACNMPSNPAEPAPQAEALAAPTEVAPVFTLIPTLAAPAPAAPENAPVEDLRAQLLAETGNAYDSISILPLEPAPGMPPVWAGYSSGIINFDLDPAPAHFVAIYTWDGGWRELARFTFPSVSEMIEPVPPDIIAADSIEQVPISPERVFLEVQGVMGAHGGTYTLLSFNGSVLKEEVSGSSDGPGASGTQDVNGDGRLEVVLDDSNHYVFCYACGVAERVFRVFEWMPEQGEMSERVLQPLLMGQAQPLRDPVNRAVALAEAGLWKDALSPITEGRALLNQYPDADVATVEWDYALIQLHTTALIDELTNGAYPLLGAVFYGDYARAVDLFRGYAPEQIFTPKSPLVAGTVAEGFESDLVASLLEHTNNALAVQPDLADAYFLRGWAQYLADPANPQARADILRAAELAPQDDLLSACADWLQ